MSYLPPAFARGAVLLGLTTHQYGCVANSAGPVRPPVAPMIVDSAAPVVQGSALSFEGARQPSAARGWFERLILRIPGWRHGEFSSRSLTASNFQTYKVFVDSIDMVRVTSTQH